MTNWNAHIFASTVLARRVVLTCTKGSMRLCCVLHPAKVHWSFRFCALLSSGEPPSSISWWRNSSIYIPLFSFLPREEFVDLATTVVRYSYIYLYEGFCNGTKTGNWPLRKWCRISWNFWDSSVFIVMAPNDLQVNDLKLCQHILQERSVVRCQWKGSSSQRENLIFHVGGSMGL